MINKKALYFNQEEYFELLQLFKDSPKWKNKLEMVNNLKFSFNDLDHAISDYVGCASDGYCFFCQVIVADSTCFCVGGNCPICGKHVAPRSIPAFLQGEYKVYTQNSKTWGVRTYKDGKYTFKSCEL